MEKKVVIYLPEGFADWEGAFIMPEFKEAKRPFIVVSETGQPVQSIGGLKVSVEGSLDSIKAEMTEALVLIGSDSWANPKLNAPVLKLAREFLDKGILVAGICAASVALARTGAYEKYIHTSNDLGGLKYLVPEYKDEKNYRDELVVVDRNLITAPGVGFLEFSREIFKYLGMYTETKRAQWFDLYKKGVKPPAEFWEN